VSDTFLDRQLKPRWKGERCAMVIKWPIGITDTEITEDTEPGRLWNEYARLRLTGLQQDGDHSAPPNSISSTGRDGRWFYLLLVGAIQQEPGAGPQRRDLCPAARHEPAAGQPLERSPASIRTARW
jgi:hypothetical protein